jgi:periplasmic protein TonB
MQPNQLMQSPFLDILFDQRNKAYGAYTLRKYYPSRLAAGLVLSVTAGVVLILLLSKFATTDEHPVFTVIPVTLSPINPDDFVLPLPPPQPPAAALAPSAMVRDLVPVIVPDQPVVDPVPTLEEKEIAVSGSITREGSYDGINTMPVETAGPGNIVNESAVVPPAAPEIFAADNVDEPAEFPGGKLGLSRFLQRNLVNPGVEENHRVQVMVRFVIDKEGNIARSELEKEGGKIYDEEVLRVIRKMPKWKPARQHGNPVPMYFVLPVTFVAGSEG